MPHDLATTNGQTAMMYAGEVPWHGLGTELEEPATAEQAIKAAGLNYDAQLRPLTTDDGIPIPNRSTVTRDDWNQVLGVVTWPQEPGNGDSGPEPAGSKAIRWKREMPPQKWMNFYTKVLSRFASSPGLKLQVTFEVTFEVPAEGDQGQSKADDARSGLKELGLNDDVEFGP